jgi:hypothetical protein
VAAGKIRHRPYRHVKVSAASVHITAWHRIDAFTQQSFGEFLVALDM